MENYTVMTFSILSVLGFYEKNGLMEQKFHLRHFKVKALSFKMR